MKKILLVFVLLFFCNQNFGQSVNNKIDSLQVLIKQSKPEESLNHIYKLGILYGSNTKDSIQFSKEKITAVANNFNSSNEIFNFKMGVVTGYYDIDKYKEANAVLEETSKLIQSIEDEARFYRSKAQLLQVESSFEDAKQAYQEAILRYKKIDNERDLKECYNNIAACAQQLGQYEEAIQFQQKALSLAEKLNDITSKSKALNNISVLYQKLDDLETSEKYILEALKIDDSINDKAGIAGSYINLGIVNRKIANANNDTARFQKARESYMTALQIAEEENLYRIKAASLANLANLENDFENYETAIKYGKESIAFSIEQNNVFGEMISRLNLGYSYRMNKNYLESEIQLQKALKIAKQIKFQRGIEECYRALSDLYSDTGQFEKSLTYFKDLTKLKDSLASVEVKNNINEMEIKYETEKKERDLAETRADLAESELKVRQKNNLIYGSLGLALILGLLGYLFYNQQKLKNRQLQKEAELKEALVKIETQNKLQEQRLRISRDLHDNIGAQLTFIISSIDNLKYGLKEATKTTRDKLSSISDFTSQTIYELRDTIWAMNKEDITFEDLQVRISNFIDKAKVASEKTQFSFSIDSAINPEHSFSSVVGMNIYRIIQEAVNNSLKYADASEIKVSIKKEASHFTITVMDNGKGYDINTVEMGNGLNSMKKRAKDINTTINYDSEIGKGTKISFTF